MAHHLAKILARAAFWLILAAYAIIMADTICCGDYLAPLYGTAVWIATFVIARAIEYIYFGKIFGEVPYWKR